MSGIPSPRAPLSVEDIRTKLQCAEQRANHRWLLIFGVTLALGLVCAGIYLAVSA